MDLLIHQGLGDFIICNGLIRNICKLHDYINVFTVDHNFDAINFMFRDLKNLNYIIWSHDNSIRFIGNITEENSDFYRWYSNNIKKGLDGLLGGRFIYTYNLNNKKIINITNNNTRVSLDISFYECANIEFEKKWIDFYVDRDMNSEINLFKKLNLKENEYIFVQEDRNRGFLLNRNKINTNLPIISSSEVTANFFDFCYIIENANEVHMMASSMYHLVEHLNIKNGNKLFCHWYAKPQGDLIIDRPVLKKQWNYFYNV
jgi:hypothetical protein